MASNDTRLLSTPVHHSLNLVHAMDHGWHMLANSVTASTWTPVSNFLKGKVLESLNQIKRGELSILSKGVTTTYGHPARWHENEEKNLRATLVVKDEAFWTRLVLFGDLGFAESYMDGMIACEDISSLLRIFIVNRDRLQSLTGSGQSIVLSLGRKLTAYKFFGSLSNSRANISAHYDLGNVLFKNYLSEDMNYSSAIFRDFNEDLRSGPLDNLESHEDAQLRKMRNILNKARIQPGDRVLEIGTGWGSLSLLAASSIPDVQIDTLTLSSEQAALAVKRIASAALSSRVTVHLLDFRRIRERPEWEGAFDRVISVEMMEHVGRDFLSEFWKVVDWAMRKRGECTGVVQVITMPESRIPAYDSNSVDFVQKWVRVFPGCYIPSLTQLISSMESGTLGRLTVDSVSNIGPHYARTLREWKRKFLANWQTEIEPLLVQNHGLDDHSLGAFKRRWLYYFDYCEAGFATRTLGDHIITFTREGNVALGCTVDPLDVDSEWAKHQRH